MKTATVIRLRFRRSRARRDLMDSGLWSLFHGAFVLEDPWPSMHCRRGNSSFVTDGTR